MASGYWAPLAIGTGDGPTLTAAAAATCLPVSAKITFPPNSIQAGSVLRITAKGRISCVVTTPGTARFDVRLASTVVFDTGALNLNTTAQTTVPWWLDLEITCRTAGSSGNFFGFGRFQSVAVVGSAAVTAGGNGALISSVSGGPGTAPAVGSNVDLTVSNTFDMFFTQTVATGSFTVHNFMLESGSVALM
jgi:hypothetical protein